MILDRIWAVAGTRGVPNQSPTGPPFRVEHRYSYEPLELRSRQPRELPVNISHDWTRLIGTVRHLEVGGHPGEVWAVADIREGQLPEEEQLYFSLEGIRGGHDGAVLSALAVTGGPAGSGWPRFASSRGTSAGSPKPRRSGSDPPSPYIARLLERARAATRDRRYGEGITVENRHAPPVPRSTGTRRRPVRSRSRRGSVASSRFGSPSPRGG
jgi:hypothetical protein